MGLGGAGETQLEADQRMISQRIKSINHRLDKVRRQRTQSRRSRARADIKTISLAGYTNAGKSTLFNTLCKSEIYVADQLFATLDTTTRQMYLSGAGQSVSVSDTVGFIRDLPHGLVEAFSATLQEAVALMAKGGIDNKNKVDILVDHDLTAEEITSVTAFLGALDCGTLKKPDLPK